ncbi:MAG: ABC transporter permease [Acidobacteria bacterium]|nr:ABC transporter permease [Acidobacteriota bacterium]
MSLRTRIQNLFRKQKLQREIDEEFEDHIERAVDAGRSRDEAERALGRALQYREASTDIKLAVWLDSLKSDTVFGIRQLKRRPTATLAAVISLALAIGAVTAAFRLIDAVLLRPMPVADPASLYVVNFTVFDEVTGKGDEADSFSYPQFRELRDAVKDKADLMVISYTSNGDLTYSTDNEMEKAYHQYVSGNHFSVFGLHPAAGRLFTGADDQKPGAHPVAVISYDYWTRRFGRSATAIGQTFRSGTVIYEIVGVAPEGYTGTETGTMTDCFIPAMQNAEAINNPNWSWMRIWARSRPGVPMEQIQQPLQASFKAHRLERIKLWGNDVSKAQTDRYVNSTLLLSSAASGASGTQKSYRRPLLILAAVVLLVLLIACANVANLLTAQAASREREMALRVSIGAGRGRLLQLMLLECLLLAVSATALGALFAWWSAPFVVGMINPPDNPVRLNMPADWRVLAFSAVLAFAVTVLFGLAPAIRASGVKPATALKGGEDPHARRRLMNSLIAAQVAFCFLVHFVAGLFVASFTRLSNQPTGFAVDRMLLLETGVSGPEKTAKRPLNTWAEIIDRVRAAPGVQSAALSGWGLMSGSAWSSSVRINGNRVDDISCYFLSVSPGWLDTMDIPRIDGRDFTPTDKASIVDEEKVPHPGVAIVNEAFARKYFNGENPVGKSFERGGRSNVPVRTAIIGYVRDARYRNMREKIRPTVYVPFGEDSYGALMVRTASPDPTAMGPALRRLVQEVNPEFRVSNVRTQAELVRNQTIRERLLATLSLFFALVALVLAAVGLYGVLNYSVLQRRREIGIRMALGAQPAQVARHISSDVFLMLILGSAIGLGAGLASERFIESLLFEVKGTDLGLLAAPMLTLFSAALLAAVPPIISATRTDPATALRNE